MKHLNIFLVAALFIVGVGVSNAQDKNNPWSIELGVNAVDFFPIEKTDTGRFPIETKGVIKPSKNGHISITFRRSW